MPVWSVPPGPGPETWSPEPPRRPSRRWVWIAALSFLLVLALSAAFVTLPYVSIRPGSARQVDDLVRVRNARSYPPKGEVLLTTVALNRVNPYEAVYGWLDPDIDVLPERDLLGPQTRKEYRRRNFQAMTDSKQIATFVALRHLGYQVDAEGDGAIVGSVVAGYPAAGVVEPGEAIVAVDGEPVGLAGDLVEAIRPRHPGDTVELAIVSPDAPEARPRLAKVALGRDPDSGGPLLGVGGLTTRNQRFNFPIDVDIDSGDIGGPSAGLAFTLAIIDVLTPGELTGGLRVAATGTIELNGTVGPVGGVAQKSAAVRRAGIHLFLVPSAEYEEARAHAGGDLRVEKVDSLDDALRALARLEGSNALALGSPGGAA